jgi:hypothetical protein
MLVDRLRLLGQRPMPSKCRDCDRGGQRKRRHGVVNRARWTMTSTEFPSRKSRNLDGIGISGVFHGRVI